MLMGVIYYSERISAKGKCTRGKVHRRPDTSFQESFPSRSHRCSWFPQQLYKMLSSRKCIRNRKFQSAPHFSWALVMKAPYSHIPKFQTPGRKVGVQHEPCFLHKEFKVKVCSQQEEGETMLSGESHPEHFPEQEKGPQTTLEASRMHSDQKEKSGLCGSKYPSISISPADLIPSVSGEHLRCPLSSCSQKLFGRLTVEWKDC